MAQLKNSTHTSNEPRYGQKGWWIFVIILLIASGIFWGLGRTDSGAERTDRTTSSPVPYITEPDQIENTVEAAGDIPDSSQITPIREADLAPN